MKQSLTDRVVNKIRKNIKEHIWNSGEYILPMRVIAEQEKVSRGVVSDAVSVLVGEGVLERVPRHGIKVCDGVSASAGAHDARRVKELAEQCAELIRNRRTGDELSCRQEDIEAIQNCFAELMGEELIATKEQRSVLMTAEDVLLFDKGIRCAGWSLDRFTLFLCNLSCDKSDLVRGNLLDFTFDSADNSFDDRTMDYVEKRVHPNDTNDYLALMNSKFLIEKGKEDEYNASIEYRERISEKYRWIKLSINVSKDTQTGDIQAYLLYQDIDEEKRKIILLKERTEEDALTGALNRRAFMLQSEQLLSESDENRQHAFLMLDVDGFKSVNDMFGHPIGDKVLSDLSKSLHTILRQGDLFGRIGGDEFVICLKDISFDAVIEKKAEQINSLMRRVFDNGISISGSIGIAVFPRDGKTYDQIYSKMDMALYHAKESGKDRFEFFKPGMTRNEDGIAVSEQISEQEGQVETDISLSRKKILVVDDVETNRNLLTEMLKDEYIVLQAKDGRRALLTLRRYGVSISAVLLDLVMPGVDGFEVLQNMQREPILKSIPVIIVSGMDDDENEFRAIEMGAMDFVKKPVDQKLLKLRIKNTVNKQENERLRIQNSYLQLQGEEEQRYRHIVQSTETVVIEHDWVNSVFTYDKAISQHLAGKYDHRPLWRILLSDMVAGSMDVKAMQTMVYELANSKTQQHASIRIKLKTNTGEKHWFEMKALKINDEFNIAHKLLITLNDVNEDMTAEEKLRKLVERDSLTGIYNRTFFLQKMRDLLGHSQNGKWMLSIIDIDGFKVFNCLYGHDEGDRLLTYIAKQLDSELNHYGGVCGRIQADTFAVLHPSRQDCVERITYAFNKGLEKYATTMKLSSCTGRYYIEDITMSINAILDCAMIAHRAAKKGTDKDIYFTEGMQKMLLHDQKIISNMENALENTQFCLYFQPIYEYETHRIVSAEALVRWVLPDKRVILPDEFISLFEQNGFVVKLDNYVWEEACKHLRKWIDEGNKVVPVSVNISRMDICGGTLIDTMIFLTQKYHISPSLLRMEITESTYMSNIDQMIEQVEMLQEKGFIIEMDDFGSGYSSLNILSEVPVDILKLDMKFVLGKDHTGRKSKILGHIINMAKSCHMDIIAEGVETQKQAELLNSLGCNHMQGFYFSKPVSSEEFINLLQN